MLLLFLLVITLDVILLTHPDTSVGFVLLCTAAVLIPCMLLYVVFRKRQRGGGCRRDSAKSAASGKQEREAKQTKP